MLLVAITPSRVSSTHAEVACRLLAHGLQHLIVRLPEASCQEYRVFLDSVAPEFRPRILIARHYELLAEYDLGGIYWSAHARGEALPPLGEEQLLVTSIHQLDELDGLARLERRPDWVLCAPVFDSISKQGYKAQFDATGLLAYKRRYGMRLLALGGVTAQNYGLCAEMGFDGVAVLGDIWAKSGQELHALLAYPNSRVVVVAGHDPSGGAGLCADARVVESLGAWCITIPSMLTAQSADHFDSAQPVDEALLYKSLGMNLKGRSVRVAKLGMLPCIEAVERLVDSLSLAGITHIVWDPLIWVSAGGRQVMETCSMDRLMALLDRLYLVTPNRPECEAWFGTSAPEGLQQIADRTGCNILLKGGHGSGEVAEDVLYRPNRLACCYRLARTGTPKHGTGCMLASAIATLLALGQRLERACAVAQRIVHRAMLSSSGLLPRLETYHLPSRQAKLRCAEGLQYVTSATTLTDLEASVSAYLRGGGRWVQLRAKGLDTAERTVRARALRSLCDRYDAVLIINDDVEAALLSDADGVHLGRGDCDVLQARAILGQDKIIGSTCNTVEDLLCAYRSGSDYVGLGPYRYTTTKERLAPILGLQGLSVLTEAMHSLPHPLPMVAIGGITIRDVEPIMQTGVTGLAVSGAIAGADDVAGVTEQFVRLIKTQKSFNL